MRLANDGTTPLEDAGSGRSPPLRRIPTAAFTEMTTPRWSFKIARLDSVRVADCHSDTCDIAS
eukprot:30060-Pelagococcus_subviridis.AAC.13